MLVELLSMSSPDLLQTVVTVTAVSTTEANSIVQVSVRAMPAKNCSSGCVDSVTVGEVTERRKYS